MPDSEIESCRRCGAFDVKLWREYSTFDVDLLCVDCACITQGIPHIASAVLPDGSFPASLLYSHGLPNAFTFELKWYVPAIRTDDEDIRAYWGYTSIPPDALEKWKALPLRMETSLTG